MDKDKIITYRRLERARKRKASDGKSPSLVSRPHYRSERTIPREFSPGSKVLTINPKRSIRDSQFTSSERASLFDHAALAALISEVENVDVPNGPFYL